MDDLSEERYVRARQIADLQRRAERAESLAAQGAIIRASERLAGAKEDAQLEERAVKAHRHAEELAEKVCVPSLHVTGVFLGQGCYRVSCGCAGIAGRWKFLCGDGAFSDSALGLLDASTTGRAVVLRVASRFDIKQCLVCVVCGRL